MRGRIGWKRSKEGNNYREFVPLGLLLLTAVLGEAMPTFAGDRPIFLGLDDEDSHFGFGCGNIGVFGRILVFVGVEM